MQIRCGRYYVFSIKFSISWQKKPLASHKTGREMEHISPHIHYHLRGETVPKTSKVLMNSFVSVFGFGKGKQIGPYLHDLKKKGN